LLCVQDIPEMGLKKYQIASVSPGAARNHLVPTKAAVYAHYVNRELYKHEIETAQAEGSAEPEDQQAIRARVQQARLLKRLKALKLVCSQVSVCTRQQSASDTCG
jgi:ribosomal protein L9